MVIRGPEATQPSNEIGVTINILRIGVITAVVLLGIVYLRTHSPDSPVVDNRPLHATCVDVGQAFAARRAGVWVTLAGQVQRILPDTHGRYDHQRFIVRCASGQTLLVVNDISIGERVPLNTGDAVTIRGQYVWNPLGGLVHFTHHNLYGGDGGWIVDRGYRYALSAAPNHLP